METTSISASKRTVTGKAVRRLVRGGTLPGVVYGQGIEALHIELDTKSFGKLYGEAGENTVVTLTVDGVGEIKTLIHEVDLDPVTDAIRHVDFLKINLKEKIETAIPVEIDGVAPAVKNLGGTLVHQLQEVEVRCLPTDLIHEIRVDVSKLEEFGDSIHVRDLTIPSTLEVLTDPEAVIVIVAAPKVEEEVAPAADATPAEVQTTAQKSPEEVAAEEAAAKKDDKKKKD